MRAEAGRLRLALGLLLAAMPALGQTAAPRLDCAKAQTTVELNACAERDLERADKALNEAYRAALQRIDGRTELDAKVRRDWREALQDAQRKWIAFRDADCKGPAAYEWYGGTGATLAVLGCLTEKTTARTGDLRRSAEP